MANLFSDFIRTRVVKAPAERSDIPIVNKKEEIVEQVQADSTSFYSTSQFNQFRTIAQDRGTQYQIYDEMSTDSVISSALEIYADDATQYDEQGRVIWVESDDEEIARAGNRLLDILEIPERAWKHIYMACKYGDYYLRLYRKSEIERADNETKEDADRRKHSAETNLIRGNDTGADPYEEYVEDVHDPATVFDLRKRGKTAGFIEVTNETISNNTILNQVTSSYAMKDVNVLSPDRMVHISISDALSRTPETITIEAGDKQTTYEVNRGKSILYDVYPTQRELQLLEDSLLLNRLTRSSLIRLLEIEVGDMPKKEVNDYLRRMKSLIEQHISMDKSTGDYKSYQSPGPIDNIIYIPVKGGRGSISINNLGGDVNVRDIVDIEYFNNKRAGALKIPRSYLGDSGADSSGFDNGGTLTRLSIRYARTIKRIQTAYIRAITTMLNLFFLDKKLDYVNKFKVRMTSPSTQEDLERNELIQGNIELIDSIMGLMESLEGETQKKVLLHLLSNVLKMPDIANLVEEDQTPAEEVEIDGGNGGGASGPDLDFGGGPGDVGSSDDTMDMSAEFGGDSGESPDGGFTDDEYDEFEDELPT